MKVLCSVTYYYPYVSGLTIAASRFADTLSVSGYDVSVLTMQHDKHLPPVSRRKGVIIHRVPWQFRLNKGFVSLHWIIQSWRHVQSCDVVVINLPQFEGVIPALCAVFFGKRVIALYHCEIVMPQGFFNSVIQSLLEVSNMATLFLAEKVVTYTADYARRSALLRHVRQKVSYIIPPITTPRVHTQFLKQLRKTIGQTDIVIGVSARLASEKGVEYLFAAIPQLTFQMPHVHCKIVVAGPMEPVGEEAYKTKIMNVVKKYKKYVVFLGEIDPGKMGSFYSLCDVLVLPSVNRTEAFGMVQVEAMLCGVPVIASNLPGVRVPVQKTGMGLVVPPRDSTKLAQAIIRVLKDKKRFVKEKKNIEKYFSKEKSNRAFLRLFE